MKLLCSTCFNYTFFEADVEYLRELAVKNGSLVVSDSHFDECNFTDTHFRDSLEDELKSNQEDFKQFRRERHGNTLPQLWKPK